MQVDALVCKLYAFLMYASKYIVSQYILHYKYNIYVYFIFVTPESATIKNTKTLAILHPQKFSLNSLSVCNSWIHRC